MSWDQRKVFASLYISICPPKRKTTEKETSRRDNALIYTLPKDTEAVKVCRNTFLSTTGLGRAIVES